MTVRVLIADDEPLARRALAQLLATHDDVQLVAECADGAEVRAALMRTPVDLVLLDIRMPELSGLEVASLLTDGRPLVVFVTAHEEFGLPAFDRGAADYLLKPVTLPRLDVALDRVRARLAAEDEASRYRALAGGSASRHVDRLVARVGEREILIPVDEVELIAADDVYAAVHANRRRYLVRTPLDELERSLSPDRFVRVHRSYIVPVAGVVAIHHSGGSVVLELRNGATVPVSRRRRPELARLHLR
ncbi:MAG TPA: LytTR family DNA-binding domain-containing protein [Gemmatimonadaceae bacterium]|jgi:two-component system LytT family response regulator|nr:LytTR family DNA-binding domain-containing protein [Gemmatimonadaceae bacterium]